MPGLPWDRAVSVYLAEYNRIAGGPVMREQFVWETEALHRHNAYGGLPWSIRIALGGTEHIGNKGPEVHRAGLLMAIADLL